MSLAITELCGIKWIIKPHPLLPSMITWYKFMNHRQRHSSPRSEHECFSFSSLYSFCRRFSKGAKSCMSSHYTPSHCSAVRPWADVRINMYIHVEGGAWRGRRYDLYYFQFHNCVSHSLPIVQGVYLDEYHNMTSLTSFSSTQSCEVKLRRILQILWHEACYPSFLAHHIFLFLPPLPLFYTTPNPIPLIIGVAMEACEFWSALSDDNDAHGVLQSHLATLIPSLISRLQLKEEQILQVKTNPTWLKCTLLTTVAATWNFEKLIWRKYHHHVYNVLFCSVIEYEYLRFCKNY